MLDVIFRALNETLSCMPPRFMRLTGEFNVRGGIYTSVIVEHLANGWLAAERFELP